MATSNLLFSAEDMGGQPQQSQQPSAPSDGGLFSHEEIHGQPAFQPSIHAPERPKSFMGKLASWVDNVEYDLKNGTDMTGVGAVMKSLGAHGLDAGQGEHVADFMASLPLGLLKAMKGGAELTPSVVGGEKGKTWQGVKDLVGGGLQAMQIPAAFVAPEASPLSEEGLLAKAASGLAKSSKPVAAAASKVGELAQGTKAVFMDLPKGTEAKLVNTIGEVAENAGFARSEAPTLKAAVTDLAGSFKSRAQSVYQDLAEEAPGFQELKDRIQQLGSAYKKQVNLDPAKATEIEAELTQAKRRMSELLDEGQTARWKQADQDWARFRAIEQAQNVTNRTANLTTGKLEDTDKLATGVRGLSSKMKGGHPIDVLSRAFGEEAGTIRQIVQDDLDLTSHSQAAKQFWKWAGITGGLVGGAGGAAKILSGSHH